MEYVRAKLDNVTTQDGPSANCDSKEMATGGGGSISGATDTAALKASRPLVGSSVAWVAEGSTTVATGRTVTSYAVCGPKPVTYQDQGSFLGPGDPFNYGDSCAAPAAQVSGGGVYGENDLQIVAMRPDPTDVFDWVTSVRNLFKDEDEVNRVLVCTQAYDLRYRINATDVDGGTGGKVVARCHGDEAVTGGGLVTAHGTAPDFQTWAVASRPVDDPEEKGRTPDDGWLARAHNGRTHRRTLTAFAICKA